MHVALRLAFSQWVPGHGNGSHRHVGVEPGPGPGGPEPEQGWRRGLRLLGDYDPGWPGLMFWFTRKRFFGSYFALRDASRA